MERSLLIGCGNSRAKKVYIATSPNWTGKLTTIDMNPNCGADVVHDLEQRPLPFPDDTFDEMGAYDVLEHIGKQGDWRGWFDEMAEYWRILKPGGYFGILVPIGEEMTADPGHTRFFGVNHFGMLTQEFYQYCIDNNQPITDYRWYWKKNFYKVFMEKSDHHIGIMLQKA